MGMATCCDEYLLHGICPRVLRFGGYTLRILLTGSRTWTKVAPVQAFMLGMKDATFILGDNPNGLDAIALRIAKKYDLKYIVKYAEWEKHQDCYCKDKTELKCKGAGHRRNGDMVTETLL